MVAFFFLQFFFFLIKIILLFSYIRLFSFKEIGREAFKEERNKMIGESDIYYGLGQNTILLRTSKQTMNSHYNWKVVREFNDWGVPLVVDLSFSRKGKHFLN